MTEIRSPFRTAEDIFTTSQIDYAIGKLDDLPDEIFVPLFSKWAAENRYIPEGVSDWYGYFDPENTPHLIEILDRLHPDDKCKVVIVLKSVQSFLTTTVAENAIGAYIRYRLGSILFVTSTKNIAKIRGNANIDTLIDNSKLAQYLSPFSSRNGKGSGDTTFYKEFIGNLQLMMTSYGSPADSKSNKFNFIVLDEIDEAKIQLKDLGNTVDLYKARTLGTIDYKMLLLSSSKNAKKSNIWINYLTGDQREYNIPCRKCGEKQVLVLKRKDKKFGLTFKREEDPLTHSKVLISDTIKYICMHCGEDFYESDKQWFMKNGIWIPTAVPEDPERTSYHVTGFLSPSLLWTEICQGYINSRFGKDVPKFKSFTIDIIGNPWLDVKKSVDWEVLKNKAEDYSMGEVPEGRIINVEGVDIYHGPILFYGGVDVQGDRLELHVVGYGYNYEKWTIDYQVFYGDTKNINDPCWLALHNYIIQKRFKVCGKDIAIGKCAIDCGYDPRKAAKRSKDYKGKAHIVYEFVSRRTAKFVAVMGNPDDRAIGMIKDSRINDDKTTLTKRYMVSVSALKEQLMNTVENRFGYGTLHVPKYTKINNESIELPDDWYKQFLSERYQEKDKKSGEYEWHAFYRNEVLDTFNYTEACYAIDNVSSWSNQDWSDYYYLLMED